MHDITLITTIAASLGFAFVVGFIVSSLRLPVLLGYLIAGILLGPAVPGFVVADLDLSMQLAEIGVMLLMFGVGLHFSIGDLMAVRKIAVPGAIVQISTATILSMSVTMGYWGWGFAESLVFGLSLSVASTVVLLKALEQRGITKSINGQIAIGWLIVEDLVMILILVLLPPLSIWLAADAAGGDAAAGQLFFTLIETIAKIGLFILLMLVIGRRFFPWLLWRVAKLGSRELFTLCVISAAVSIAYASTELFGVSFALGAFFAGVVLRESHLSHRAAEESLPLRDAFAVLFFVSVGMLFNPMVLVEQPWHVLITVLIIIIGKSLAAFALVLAFRYPLNTALTVSVSLAQIGEFSFILAGLSVYLGILSLEKQSIILAAAIISIALNPFIFRLVEPLQRWILARSKLARKLEYSTDDPLAELPMNKDTAHIGQHVVLVGYGRVGKRIAAAMKQQNITYVVAEQNRERVEHLRDKGSHAVAGDAAEAAVLIQAHVARASTLIVAIADIFRARQMIEIARMLNPKIEILVRAHSDEEVELLQQEKVDKIFFGEQELANSMIKDILERRSLVNH
jgi:monovalent cation:H+ antiporter-2, CPA2 family